MPHTPYHAVVHAVKDSVRAYWDERPCGDRLADADRGTRRYFDAVEAAKDRLEPYIHGFADFAEWRGRDVLEIGCGVGTDTARFARSGARITAIDLSGTAVALTQRHLEEESLVGDVLQADAEALPFPDGSFDLVYSWGVLHHTPDTRRAVREVARTLRPGGEARVMLYNRHSLFALGVWLRRGMLQRRSLAEAIATVESPGTKGYTADEVRALFDVFPDVHVETIATPYDRRVAGPLAALVPGAGWNHLIRARPA